MAEEGLKLWGHHLLQLQSRFGGKAPRSETSIIPSVTEKDPSSERRCLTI